MAARLSRLLLPALLALTAQPALAECQFDQFGNITNPNAPECRDAQYRYTRDDNSGNNVALGYDVPLPVDSLTAVDGFRSYQSLFEQHQSLDALHDVVAGQIVGRTFAGRDVWVYRIGDADDTTTDGGAEPAALVNGTIHAREWQSPEAVTELFEQLVETRGDAGLGQYLIENLNLLVIPVLNIDGFLQTQRFPDRFTADPDQPRDGRMRRKNMRNSNTGGPIDEDIEQTADNFLGIDLNRNNPSGYGQNNGSSNRNIRLVYRGAAPQSEPEIQTLVAAAELAPTERLRYYSDVHSFSQIFFTPIIANVRRDDITRRLVDRMRAASKAGRYRYGPSIGTGIGLTSDFFARTYEIPAWTLETEPLRGGVDYGGTSHGHSGFILPDSEAARMRDEVTLMQLAGLYRQTDAPRLQALQIRDDATGELRYSARWRRQGDGRRLVTLTDKALIPGNTYRLWLAFNKPMRWRNDSGQIDNYPGQSVSLIPSLELQFPSLADAGSDLPIEDAAASWLESAGGNGTGYLDYRDDALSIVFTVPAGLDAGEPLPAVLVVDAEDMLQSMLDSDPVTRVDWDAGHWIGYEDEQGSDTDTGGLDCNFVVFVSSDSDASAPAKDQTCRQAAAPAPPPGPDPGTTSGGGGGGAALWLLPILGLAAVLRRQRRSARLRCRT